MCCHPVGQIRPLQKDAERLVDTQATNCARPCAALASGPSRSSSVPTGPRASWCCRAAGSSNAPWHGSIATAASPRTSSNPSHRQPHGCSSPQSSSSHAASQDHDITTDNFESASDFPISSFLFWRLEQKNKDEWPVYEFIREFDGENPHNPPANRHLIPDHSTYSFDAFEQFQKERTALITLALKQI